MCVLLNNPLRIIGPESQIFYSFPRLNIISHVVKPSTTLIACHIVIDSLHKYSLCIATSNFAAVRIFPRIQ